MVENQASQTFVLVSRSQSANLCQNCATFEQSQNSKTQLDIQLTDKRLEARLKTWADTLTGTQATLL